MEVEKIRNLSDEELALEGRKASEALFRLRFQMKLGQTEGAKKLRELKKDIARINTIGRERELGIHTLVAPKHHHAHAEGQAEGAAPVKSAKKKTGKSAKKKTAKKSTRKAGGRSAAARKTTAKPSANKKKAARSSSVKKG
ncbi:MAG TPA: 50S ribosomal protein L29 [Acidobacteriaceae bacterium]|nr:50S ribosomal protein L29 [Acidobacteriaceae bacterium]